MRKSRPSYAKPCAAGPLIAPVCERGRQIVGNPLSQTIQLPEKTAKDAFSPKGPPEVECRGFEAGHPEYSCSRSSPEGTARRPDARE
ncbi:hypothetical protein PLUA15_230122 [Pseudomonas lundensis]|uniref:Uncharacterized protein n=1 Tax=Pseudomonas lundensis TaxID=86185 RepID=A0AAX2H6J0_9PSED|nr:hypothetical protein PLUA15_230122 [Pseudomonas lundensis]